MRRILIAFIIIFLVSCSPLRKYSQLPEVRAWESEIEEFEKLDIAKSYPSDAVLFAGSSSIRLWSTINSDMLPYNVIQRGYGGARLSDFAVNAARIIHPHQCSAIVLFIANDITGEDNDKSPTEVAKLFRSVLLTIRKEFPKTPVFWIGITPTPARWHVWPEIELANQMIEKVCSGYYNTYFIKTDTEFTNSNGLPRKELFLEDNLHLNTDGYALWTKLIKQELNKVLLKQ